MSSKKITYSSDFKLKVLDYYFKHGGDDKFGLKKKTAGHFNIDKKTINRMLNNPDMVKRARKVLAARKSAGSTKPPPSSTRHPVKPAVKRAGTTQNRTSTATPKATSSSQSSASSSSNTKASTSSTSSTKTVSSSSRHQVNSNTSGSNKTTPVKSKPTPQVEKGTPGVEVFELPEDPDYSLLKRSINSSSNGVASLAKLLVTGTEEVRNVVLNECDVILECKVCRNLFRSIVNFLAHKRIYCQEEFADVRTLFHKGDVQGVTSQSNTVVVEPEPPPEDDNYPTMRTTIPTTHTSPLRSVAPGRTRHSGIDSIALKLARKRKAYHASVLSSPTATGSSSYYRSLSEVSRRRDKLSRDCSVVLEDISGVTNAVFQTFVPPGSSSPSTSMSSMVDEAANSKTGLTVAINQNGDVVKTAPGNITSMDVEPPSMSTDLRDLTCLLCNTRFATQKTLSVHQRSHHGMERCIYSCPICQASFLSMWAVVKHLQRTHKKTKSQVERLRKVVRKNVRKKMIYQNVDKDKNASDLTSVDGDDDDDDNNNDDENEVEDSNDSSAKTSEEGTSKKSGVGIPMQATPVKASPHKGDEFRPTGSPDHRCVKCERKFSTPCALESHDKFCSLKPILPPESKMNPLLRSETPEKKISIQIRKDYKKSVSSFDSTAPNISENKYTQVMFKIPKTPQERENQTKIEEMMGEFCDLPSMSCIPCGRRYQTVTTLKRHAAWHIDWTRFECNLCQHRNYHRYEVINHCIVKHNVKESVAGGMVTEAEFVGQLKYFLDDEDATNDSQDIDQDQSEEHCPPSNEDGFDKTNKSEAKQPTKEDRNTNQLKKEEALANDASNQLEKKPPVAKVSSHKVKNELPEVHEEDSATRVGKNSEECRTSGLKDKDLKNSVAPDGCRTKSLAPEVKGIKTEDLKSEINPSDHDRQCADNQMETSATKINDICHQSIDSDISNIPPNKPEEPTTQLEKIVGSELKSKLDKCRKYVQKLLLPDTSSHIGDSKVNSQKEKDEKFAVEEMDDGNKNDTKEIGDVHSPNVDLDNNSEKCKLQSKEPILEETSIDSQDTEAPEKVSPIAEATDFGESLGISTCKLKRESDFSISTTENSSLPFGYYTENIHVDKKQELADLHVKKEKLSELEECSKDKDDGEIVDEDSSQDSANITTATDKMYDSESISSCLETSEQESVTECSEHTVASQSASTDNVTLEEILVSDSDSEVSLDEFKVESISGKGNVKSRSADDDQNMANKTKDFDLPSLKNPGLDDFCSYDVKPSAYALTFKMEKDVKLVPKDDLSLELKDFVGFPSTKDEKYQRPHRMRRSVEQKDFIYENKRTTIPLQTEEEEDDKDSISLSSSTEKDHRSGGRFSSRRRSLLLKTESEDCTGESCNGSSFQSTGSKKNERFSLSPKKGVDSKLPKSTGEEESLGERRVRFVRRKVDTNSQGSEAIKRNLEKPESHASSSNMAVKKESPSSTRCSSRLKVSISPVPKKKKKKEVFNAHILTNGQDQSSTVVTSKVKS